MSLLVFFSRSFSMRNWIPWGEAGPRGSGLHTGNGERERETCKHTWTDLLRVHVEFLSAHGHLFVPLHVLPETH